LWRSKSRSVVGGFAKAKSYRSTGRPAGCARARWGDGPRLLWWRRSCAAGGRDWGSASSRPWLARPNRPRPASVGPPARGSAGPIRNPQTPNDHSDVDYDRGALHRLRELHSNARAWLTPLEAAAPRLAIYRLRLDRAIERLDTGDTKYVASPRVDSYHSVWFELHEDLIQLAGRTRETEV